MRLVCPQLVGPPPPPSPGPRPRGVGQAAGRGSGAGAEPPGRGAGRSRLQVSAGLKGAACAPGRAPAAAQQATRSRRPAPFPHSPASPGCSRPLARAAGRSCGLPPCRPERAAGAMPRIDADLKLDFKDVLLRPKRSSLKSRAEVGSFARVARGRWVQGAGMCQPCQLFCGTLTPFALLTTVEGGRAAGSLPGLEVSLRGPTTA